MVTKKVDNEDKTTLPIRQGGTNRIMLDKTQYKNGIEFNYKELGQRGGWIINESGLYSLILSIKFN